MKAKLCKLPDNYYSTGIAFANSCHGIDLAYFGSSRRPSERQLKQWNMTYEEALAEDMLYDEHYETADSYAIAMHIIEALKTLDIEE